ncbi:MAG: hypothetical protein ABEI75_01925 [Halobaculum sp.]
MFPNDEPERADYLLGAVGVAVVAGLVVGWVSGVSMAFGGGVGSLVATVAIADALRRPPTAG